MHRYPYPRPALSADAALFAVRDGRLAVLLVRRGRPPFEGAWALPGGFVEVGDTPGAQGEGLEAAALRELSEETGIGGRGLRLEELGVFGTPDRDPRARVVTAVYLDLVSARLVGCERAGDDAAHAAWRDVDTALRDRLAFDHRLVLRRARERIRVRLQDSPIADRSLPATFTTAELRSCYTVIDPRYTDAARFRRVRAGLVARGVLEPAAGAGKTGSRWRFRRSRRAGPHLY